MKLILKFGDLLTAEVRSSYSFLLNFIIKIIFTIIINFYGFFFFSASRMTLQVGNVWCWFIVKATRIQAICHQAHQKTLFTTVPRAMPVLHLRTLHMTHQMPTSFDFTAHGSTVLVGPIYSTSCLHASFYVNIIHIMCYPLWEGCVTNWSASEDKMCSHCVPYSHKMCCMLNLCLKCIWRGMYYWWMGQQRYELLDLCWVLIGLWSCCHEANMMPLAKAYNPLAFPYVQYYRLV